MIPRNELSIQSDAQGHKVYYEQNQERRYLGTVETSWTPESGQNFRVAEDGTQHPTLQAAIDHLRGR